MPVSSAANVLYGLPHSLYTGIARSYLRTQGIAYLELPPAHADFVERILPTIQRSIVPVLETPDGEIIQDSLDIIDHFERQGVPYPAYPEGPLQSVLAIILQYYGSQAMLRHAMHYRWSYLEQQETFLRHAFATGSDAARAETIMARMQSYLPALGVNAETIPLIEQSFENLLDILEAHFAQHPFLFGGRPSVADYGLIGPMFAHLGRDPVPSDLMKRRSPNVFRWVERMTAPGLDTPDFPGYGTDFITEDAIPSTLEPLLKQVAEEIFPELTAKFECMDALIDKLQPEDGQPVAAKAHQRHVGQVETRFRGAPITSGVAPYSMYILRRADQLLEQAGDADRSKVQAYLQRFGLDKALPGKRGYSVARRNHIEVWERR
ncbi:glutathione S-transferase family protein [Pseudomonas sp. OIL-1]|uniref:glutathione S-transferase family protein n=1 Tax=Pseudomonas sp. OIL-1 TaxID=2706126 RepID=UPI0013A72C58|nr:glutathione S-transferase family protein [Pseudomonas sp. OIL-1]QIB49818.1 glutathione S-transferase [Pseudomonas sp. OIL-1]